jgi:hypothetical protein
MRQELTGKNDHYQVNQPVERNDTVEESRNLRVTNKDKQETMLEYRSGGTPRWCAKKFGNCNIMLQLEYRSGGTPRWCEAIGKAIIFKLEIFLV